MLSLLQARRATATDNHRIGREGFGRLIFINLGLLHLQMREVAGMLKVRSCQRPDGGIADLSAGP
ncbi:hypothetical protein CFII68_13041 [Pseudomonas sp. CFII68]|nr:hypothetical protein CFII68_13041 [Pseudomonas sp. CFII68]